MSQPDPPPVIAEGVPEPAPHRSSTDSYISRTDIYRVWRDKFNGFPAPYLLQGMNGPCPLLAICNVLLLRGVMPIPDAIEDISLSEVLGKLANILIDRNNTEDADDTLRSTLDKAVELLPSLSKGMDVDVNFTSVNGFEYTSEMSIFDLLDIHVYHGWLVSQDDLAAYPLVSQLTYNQAIVKVAEYEELKHKFLDSPGTEESNSIPSDKKDAFTEGEAIAVWLDHTSHQLTTDGVIELNTVMQIGELAVLFRNNHFSTIYKQSEGRLFALVTDIGFRSSGAMWESVDQLDGDIAYLDHNFYPIGGADEAADREMAMQMQYGDQRVRGPTVVVPRENVQVVARPVRRRKQSKCSIM